MYARTHRNSFDRLSPPSLVLPTFLAWHHDGEASMSPMCYRRIIHSFIDCSTRLRSSTHLFLDYSLCYCMLLVFNCFISLARTPSYTRPSKRQSRKPSIRHTNQPQRECVYRTSSPSSLPPLTVCLVPLLFKARIHNTLIFPDI